jgi:hypothetical protein
MGEAKRRKLLGLGPKFSPFSVSGFTILPAGGGDRIFTIEGSDGILDETWDDDQMGSFNVTRG